MGGQRHAPAALPSGKTRYPLYGRLGGPQGRSGRLRKISLLEFKIRLHKARYHLYLTLCFERHIALRVYLTLGAEMLIGKYAQRNIITVCVEVLITKYVAYNMAAVCTAHVYVFTVDCALSQAKGTMCKIQQSTLHTVGQI